MMAKLIGVATVGTAPDITTLPSGTLRAYVRVCVNDQWKDSDGNRQERPHWFTLVAFQNGETGLVTSVFSLLQVGQQIYLSATPTTRQWVTNDGARRETFEIQIRREDTIRILSRKPKEDDQAVPEAERPAATNMDPPFPEAPK